MESFASIGISRRFALNRCPNRAQPTVKPNTTRPERPPPSTELSPGHVSHLASAECLAEGLRNLGHLKAGKPKGSTWREIGMEVNRNTPQRLGVSTVGVDGRVNGAKPNRTGFLLVYLWGFVPSLRIPTWVLWVQRGTSISRFEPLLSIALCQFYGKRTPQFSPTDLCDKQRVLNFQGVEFR